MKYLSLLLLLILSACQSKKDEPDLDYVNIEMFPALGGPPSNISVDLKNNLITFSNLQHIGSYDENCVEVMNKIQRPVEFIYINMNEEEVKIINSNFNNTFLESVMKSNKELLDDPKLYDNIINDGVDFEIDFVKNNKVFSTDNYLTLEREAEVKIYEVLKIIKKHTESIENKKYIDNISFFLTNIPDQTNYKQKFP